MVSRAKPGEIASSPILLAGNIVHGMVKLDGEDYKTRIPRVQPPHSWLQVVLFTLFLTLPRKSLSTSHRVKLMLFWVIPNHFM